jgi:phosphoglycerate dehydrogenase-like enzyme
MRVHFQNRSDSTGHYPVDQALWNAALARHPHIDFPIEVSFGDTDQAFMRGIADADLVLMPMPLIRKLFPVAAPRLRAVMCPNAGLESLAPYDWLPPGVVLLNNSGTHAAKAGEYALMALLMLAHRMPALLAAQVAKRWERRAGSILAARRLTVVGLGSLGGAAAQHGLDFGMHVTGVRTSTTPHPACHEVVAYDRIDDVLPRTEFLVLACPLTQATTNMIDARRLALLPQGAGLVNIGRGRLIDEPALCDALDGGHLSGAILDVFAREPLPPEHRLWTTRNVMITPHISSDDPRFYMANTLDILLLNLHALQQGRPPPNAFGLERGY